MKKSDRLIIIAVLTSCLLIIGVNVILSFRVRKGEIQGRRQLLNSQLLSFPTKPAHTIILQGTVWVNIIPADSDVVTFPREGLSGREGSSIMPAIRQQGDTLLIKGANTGVVHRPEADWSYSQNISQVTVYTSKLQHIRVQNGEAVLNGGADSMHAQTVSIQAIDATVWLGDIRKAASSQAAQDHTAFFHACRFEGTNAFLVLNKTCYADTLEGRLLAESEIVDKSADIGKTTLIISNDSKISLTGSNLLHTTIFKY